MSQLINYTSTEMHIVAIWIVHRGPRWLYGETPMKLPDELKDFVYIDMVSDRNGNPCAHIHVAACNTTEEAREIIKKVQVLKKRIVRCIKWNGEVVIEKE